MGFSKSPLYMNNISLATAFSQLRALWAVRGNKGAIVRLGLVVVTLLVGLVLTFISLPFVGGLGNILSAFLSGILSSIVAGTVIWALAKWCVFIFPKSYAVAQRFWRSLSALSIIGLVLKAMTWIYLLFLPISLFGLMLAPAYLLVMLLSKMGSEFLATLILIVLCVGALLFEVHLDICKLQGVDWKQSLRDMFAKVRQTIEIRIRKLATAGKR